MSVEDDADLLVQYDDDDEDEEEQEQEEEAQQEQAEAEEEEAAETVVKKVKRKKGFSIVLDEGDTQAEPAASPGTEEATTTATEEGETATPAETAEEGDGNATADGGEDDTAAASEESTTPAVRFRIVLDDDPEELRRVEEESTLQGLLKGLTSDSLPADCPKFLRILVKRKEQEEQRVQDEEKKIRRRAVKFGLPENQIEQVVAKMKKRILNFDVSDLPGMSLSLMECRRLIKEYNEKLRRQQSGESAENAGEAEQDNEAEQNEEEQGILETEKAKQARRRLEKFGLDGHLRDQAVRYLPKAQFHADAEKRPDALFVRPAAQLIKVHTRDILRYFHRFNPQWVEWGKATFVVVFNDADAVQQVLSALGKAVPGTLQLGEPEDGSEPEKVSINSDAGWHILLRPIENLVACRWAKGIGDKTWLFARVATVEDKKFRRKAQRRPTAAAAISATARWQTGPRRNRHNRHNNGNNDNRKRKAEEVAAEATDNQAETNASNDTTNDDNGAEGAGDRASEVGDAGDGDAGEGDNNPMDFVDADDASSTKRMRPDADE